MPSSVVLSAAVEGITDEVLLRRLCDLVGATLGDVHGRFGKPYLLARIAGFNNSARFRHWVILLDLDNDEECAPKAIMRWLPSASRLMCFRLAVKELEAWLFADAERLAAYLSVSAKSIPADPDAVDNPKRLMVELARKSRRRAIREDMVPSPGSGQTVGPAYTSRIIEFIQDPDSGWRPDVATERSDSLQSCVQAISALAQKPFQ